jgi:hypothetical protein
MAQYKEILPEKISVTCTDNDKVMEAYLDRYVQNEFMDIILNTVRLKLVKEGSVYVGRMAGLEFTAKDPQITHIKDGR